MDKGNQDFGFEYPEEAGKVNKNEENDDSEGSYKRLLNGKEITLFWLLNHYSKANKQAYKEQKARKKRLKKRMEENPDTAEGMQPGEGQHKENQNHWEASPGRAEEMEREHIVRPSFDPQQTHQPNREREDFGKTVVIRKVSVSDDRSEAMLEAVGFGQMVPLLQFPFRIGRSQEHIELCIADNPAIGRLHAEILRENGVFYLVDLNSVNHTFLNGKQIPPGERRILHNRDQIILADEAFVFYIQNEGSCNSLNGRNE